MDQSGGLVPGSRIRSPAKSTTVVTPPNAAARVAASGGCDRSSGRPPQYCGTGMAMWACGSIPPGRTILPSASVTRAASPGSAPGGGKPLGDRLEVVHLEPDVMDAGEALAPLGPGHGVVLELEDGQVEIAVAQVVPAGVRVLDPPDLLHAEHVDIELRGLVGVLGGHRNVLDLAQ